MLIVCHVSYQDCEAIVYMNQNSINPTEHQYSHWRIQRGGCGGCNPPLNFQKRWVTSVAVVISTVTTLSGKTEGIMGRGGARTDGEGPGGRWEDGGNHESGRCDN